MNKVVGLLLAGMLCVVLSSCGESEFEFSSYHAYFVFDNSVHQDATLSTAMNSLSPGIFVHITTAGSSHFAFENNQGLSSKQVVNAIDERRTTALGIYNESGIIVGFGNLSSPAVFYCYDAQCPNCYAETSLPRYTLSMTTTGLAKCSRCGRSYDMNNGGIVSSGEGGNKLIRYRATTSGPLGVLSVVN